VLTAALLLRVIGVASKLHLPKAVHLGVCMHRAGYEPQAQEKQKISARIVNTTVQTWRPRMRPPIYEPKGRAREYAYLPPGSPQSYSTQSQHP